MPFMAWVGGANEATIATSALVAVLNTAVSDNIDTVVRLPELWLQ